MSGPMGLPLTNTDIQKMPEPEQSAFRALLQEAKALTQNDSANDSLEMASDGRRFIPPESLFDKYTTVCGRYNGKQFCPINGMDKIFAFEEFQPVVN